MPETARLLLTPRWLRLTGLALAAVALCIAASIWQYQRTQDQLTVARAAVAQVADYAAVVPADSDEVPLDGLGRQVRIQGRVVPGERSFVRARTAQDGRVGFLVVDGVQLPDGRTVAVLQGWVPRPGAAPDLTGRTVDLVGRLQPDENFYAAAPVTATDPLLTVTHNGLATQWRIAADQLAPGYVTVTGAPAAARLGPVRPVVGSDPDVAFPLQNAFYSLQWLIFAGIVIVVWVRWLRDDLRERRDRQASSGGVPAQSGQRVSL